MPQPRHFYPRSPCGERRTRPCQNGGRSLFLSTLSLRRATISGGDSPTYRWHFYPRSPCGERHDTYVIMEATKVISIHALLAESDLWYPLRQWGATPFLSTLSLRRATTEMRVAVDDIKISIHALLAESDPMTGPPKRRIGTFLSTLSLRRATPLDFIQQSNIIFLSTLSLRRATVTQSIVLVRFRHFYPRSPCGERRPSPRSGRIRHNISIHALLAESDARRALGFVDPDISIHALLAESDPLR